MSLNRRSLLKSLALAPQLLRANQSQPPNILFVLSDDHSYPYLGVYGSGWMSTPNLDQFAREGMLFRSAFTAAPQCVPSRTALMTGRSPVAARMGRFSSPLPADIPTVPEVLRGRGLLHGRVRPLLPPGWRDQSFADDAQVYDKHGVRTWSKRVDFLDVSSQAETTAQFEQFLGRAPKGRPWFFWINYNDPHHVWDKENVRVDPAKIRVPPHLPDLPGVRDDLARYCGEIERADRSFAEAMARTSETRQRSRYACGLHG